MSTTMNRYEGWTTTILDGKLVWVESFEAAVHFGRKAAALKDLASLRELEIMAVKHGASMEALGFLKSQMAEANKKVIAANRKAQSKGWYTIDDDAMSRYLESLPANSAYYEARLRDMNGAQQ